MCRARAAVAPHARGAVGPRSTGGRISFHRSQLKLEFEGERARRLQDREAHILPVLNLLFDGCSKVKVWLVWRRQDGFGMPSWARSAPGQTCSLLLLTQGFSASGYSEEPTMTRIDAAQVVVAATKNNAWLGEYGTARSQRRARPTACLEARRVAVNGHPTP